MKNQYNFDKPITRRGFLENVRNAAIGLSTFVAATQLGREGKANATNSQLPKYNELSLPRTVETGLKEMDAERLMKEYEGQPIIWILKENSLPYGSGFKNEKTGVIISATHVTDPVENIYKEDKNGNVIPYPDLLKPRIFETTHLEIATSNNPNNLLKPKMILTVAIADFSVSAFGENKKECLENLIDYLKKVSPTLMTDFELSEYINNPGAPKEIYFSTLRQTHRTHPPDYCNPDLEEEYSDMCSIEEESDYGNKWEDYSVPLAEQAWLVMRGSTINDIEDPLESVYSNSITIYGPLGLTTTEQGDIDINLKFGASGSMAQITNSENKKAIFSLTGGFPLPTREYLYKMLKNNPYIMNQIWSIRRLREMIQSKYGKDGRYTSCDLLLPNAEILADFMFEFPDHFGRFTVMTQEMANEMSAKCNEELKKIQSRETIK